MAQHPKNNLVHGPKRSTPMRFVDIRTGRDVKPSANVKKQIAAARRKAR